MSAFHTIDRDVLIGRLIFSNIAMNAFLAFLAIQAWKAKRISIICLLLVAEVFLNTQTNVLFAPNDIYKEPTTMNSLPLLPLVRDPQHRVLTNNTNTPYTDFASYWEATTVRKPFSDSFVDATELREKTHLLRLQNALTPDWNMVAQIPVLNGYTTLLPADYQRQFEPNTKEARINSLSSIHLNDPLLETWSTKYFIVDRWFTPPLIPENYQKVFSDESVIVYERPALARFRFIDGTAAELRDFSENPNKITFSLENTTEGNELIIADRYEPGWRAQRNGEDITIENLNGMRKIPLIVGKNTFVLKFDPPEMKLGIIISIGTFIGTTVFMLRRKK